MNKMVSSFTKGIATGIAVGTAVGMVANPLDIRKRARMKKNTKKAIRAVADVLSNVQGMMK
jgi:uncharacterized protein YoaH (UPF0181 family)